MAQAKTVSAQQKVEQGFFGRCLSLLFKLVFFFLISGLLSILIEWAGMIWFWPEQGVHHSESMLERELTYLNDDFERSLLVESPSRFAKSMAHRFYHVTYQKTGVEHTIVWLSQPINTSISYFRKKLHGAYQVVHEFVIAAITMTEVFAVRVSVLFLALPAFTLTALVGIIDGMVSRDIRRWSGGRESSFVYHWAKRSILPSFILPWILYLAMPISIHPNFIVLPFAILFGFAMGVTVSRFKKYL